MQLAAAGAGMGRVPIILITHLHGDHYFGLPGLITSLALSDRPAPLRIISPPGLRAKLAPLLDLDRYRLPFELHFEEVEAREQQTIVTLDELEILAFPLRHRIPTNGYLIRERPRAPNMRKDRIAEYGIPYAEIPAIKAGGDFRLADGRVVPHDELTTPPVGPRSYAYCSDTVSFPELSDYVRGVDLLYHESTFLHDMATEAREKGHSTAREAAIAARAAGAGRLILGHYSSRYADLTAFEEEARRVFPDSHAARDLYHFSVPYPGRRPSAAEK